MKILLSTTSASYDNGPPLFIIHHGVLGVGNHWKISLASENSFSTGSSVSCTNNTIVILHTNGGLRLGLSSNYHVNILAKPVQNLGTVGVHMGFFFNVGTDGWGRLGGKRWRDFFFARMHFPQVFMQQWLHPPLASVWQMHTRHLLGNRGIKLPFHSTRCTIPLQQTRKMPA